MLIIKGTVWHKSEKLIVLHRHLWMVLQHGGDTENRTQSGTSKADKGRIRGSDYVASCLDPGVKS